ncbi:IclR family transcriptional regulator [Microbacterium sp. SS28]|uniref:IclR family transcriptional regulator n=1 Tax=Microbacterium sp. SS28 TaxID=2919948 RepID=UPI001FAA7C45|nr:IclR family transcriptional regulator [Microbacterium sp. SS28]
MRTASWTESVSVLDRVTAVFDAFGDSDDGLGVSELARRANLPKSTVSRIAADLVVQRFLDRDGDKLYLGVRLFELGQTVEQPRVLRQAAIPVMTELRDMTGQTVHLAVLDGSDVVVVAIMRGAPTATPMVRIGGRFLAHATALGKAILAHSPRDVVERVVGRGLESRTPHTITDPSVLLQNLADIRRLGVATEVEELALGRTCTAAAILGHGGAPVAALSVAGAVEDVLPERVGPSVRAAAATLSRRISSDRAH